MMKYYIVDAFTDRPFGGNPAAIVAEGELLTQSASIEALRTAE